MASILDEQNDKVSSNAYASSRLRSHDPAKQAQQSQKIGLIVQELKEE
ncbi:hypothetical protein [Reticulibacter mediterranei]|nr:hypothetical protein [Reticulibacter mediterranei]